MNNHKTEIDTTISKLTKTRKQEQKNEKKKTKLKEKLKKEIIEYIITEQIFSNFDWKYFIQSSLTNRYPTLVTIVTKINNDKYQTSDLHQILKDLSIPELELKPTESTTVLLKDISIKINIISNNTKDEKNYDWIIKSGIKSIEQDPTNNKEEQIKKLQKTIKEEKEIHDIFDNIISKEKINND